MKAEALSLRGLMAAAAAALLALALVVGAAPLLITRELGQRSHELSRTLQQLGATEEVEVALLLHDRERQLLAATGDPAHARAAQEALAELHSWLQQLPAQGQTAEQTGRLEQLRREVTRYLAHAQDPAPGAQGQAALGAVVGAAEALNAQALREAQEAIAAAQRWRTVASVLGVGSGLLLLGGLAALLWAARRWLLQPLQRLRAALTAFSPSDVASGSAGSGGAAAVPEAGPRELQDISIAFNALAARLARQREAQLSFLAGVAHDLRNPLGALKATAQRMHPSRPLLPEPQLRERFALVGRQVERLDRMVEDLLDTTRVEAGQLALHVAPHDLGQLVREAVELHRDVSEQHTLQLQLPPAPLSAAVDAVRVSQVLNNLLSNALKYSPGGGVVQVRLERAEGEARVSVQDGGVGIPPEEHASIFEPFRRASASRGHIPGVGLGLSVARRIALAHGGRISLQSAPGQGSTFTLHLPLAAQPADTAAHAPGGAPAAP